MTDFLETAQPYVELHCHSNFSFLDGASHPEELVHTAQQLGLAGLALTDHNGMYGVVRFAEAARSTEIRTIFGAELTLNAQPAQASVADPAGNHVVVLARDPAGYQRLCRAITAAQLAGEKGFPVFHLEELAEFADGHWLILTGCRKGTVPAALATHGPEAATQALKTLTSLFGQENIAVELWDHSAPMDSARNDALADIATAHNVPLIVSNNVHYATPARARLANTLAAIRARRSLDDLDGWFPAVGAAYLRSSNEMANRFARYPGALKNTAELGLSCAFDLRLVSPQLPYFPVPAGHTEVSWLKELTEQGALIRYGPRDNETAPGAYAQLDRELAMIEQLNFPGYFLIVWDIVEFCRRSNILCQGRGSAANSAVCYALGITKVDSVRYQLLFERFLSPARDGPPDIDLDIESDRREEVIQYVYGRYGRHHAAQVANVISYRPRSAVRDVARAFGYSPGQQDAWSKQLDHYAKLSTVDSEANSPAMATEAPLTEHDIPTEVMEFAAQLQHFPRHLGIHSGGMVICDRPISEVCPVEWARMPGRTVVQWDKDDCAAAGLVKFDLLGLGMLSALHYAIDLIADYYDIQIDLATLPQDDAVYRMLSAADSLGVFQVESRAQMATLPRLRPENFYDLVVEVALIRPGPIQGGSVHPYIRRRNGLEEVTYPHPLLKPALEKTLGVPLFQEQLMQIAIDVAGFSATEADQLRQAMSSKRSAERLAKLRPRLLAGMAEREVPPDVAEEIYRKLHAFADFGFPESHAISFAYLVYASAWIKLHYPAAFLASLLNAQPMGFYSPQSLVADARRHGVTVLRPNVNVSSALATLEPGPEGNPAVRLGLSSIQRIGDPLAEHIAAGQPFATMVELAQHIKQQLAQQRRKKSRKNKSEPAHRLLTSTMESLATAGALDCFGVSRREALWMAGAAARAEPDHIPGINPGVTAPELPVMNDVEKTIADLMMTGISPDSYPTQYLRPTLDKYGVITAEKIRQVPNGTMISVAGIVTHRQRPATARGVTFINVEDETGLINIICSPKVWERFAKVARNSSALFIQGRLERNQGVFNVIAHTLTDLAMPGNHRSRDFR